MDLTKFNLRAKRFTIFAWSDQFNAYEDNGLVLFPAYISIMALNLEDNSAFTLKHTFIAKTAQNEDGATIIMTAEEVAQQYINDEIKAKGHIIDLTQWDAAPTHQIHEDDALTAKAKADLLTLKENIKLVTKKHDENHTEFEFYDTKYKMLSERLRSFEPDFKTKFSHMLERHLS